MTPPDVEDRLAEAAGAVLVELAELLRTGSRWLRAQMGEHDPHHPHRPRIAVITLVGRAPALRGTERPTVMGFVITDIQQQHVTVALEDAEKNPVPVEGLSVTADQDIVDVVNDADGQGFTLVSKDEAGKLGTTPIHAHFNGMVIDDLVSVIPSAATSETLAGDEPVARPSATAPADAMPPATDATPPAEDATPPVAEGTPAEDGGTPPVEPPPVA